MGLLGLETMAEGKYIMRHFIFHQTVHRLTLTLTGIWLVGSVASAGDTFQPVFKPTLEVRRAAGAINVDGAVNDPGWKGAARADNFVERNPGDNTRPEAATEAYLTYDESRLYVAFVCHDDPTQLRATMTQRDQYQGDDAVCFLVDTYGNATWAYEFFVNPYGIQKDMLWSAIGDEDPGYDLIWESAARITDSGYTVEIAIPFSSLRFPNKDVQTWRIEFWRNRPRQTMMQYSWTANDRNEQCWPCQWGTVNGIADVRPGKGIEILPAFVANQLGTLNSIETSDESSPDGSKYRFDDGKMKGQLSLGGKYAINSDITVEAAINPDFSQIESDAAQIDVNSPVALMYPERRPFFQEGSDIFRTPFASFYTRMIRDPQLSVKLTGRSGRTAIGFLSARDDNTPYMIPLDANSITLNTGKSTTAILRASRQYGENSQLGFIITDRRFDGGGSGTVLSLDGFLRLSQQYFLMGQGIVTHSREPNKPSLTPGYATYPFDRGKHTIGLDGESYFGNAFIVKFGREARHWNYFMQYNQIEPTYRTQNGFDPINNHSTFDMGSSYAFTPKKGMFVRLGPQFYALRRWNFITGAKSLETFNVGYDVSTRFWQTGLSISYNRSFEVWRGREFDNLGRVGFGISGRPHKAINFDFHISQGRGLSYEYSAKGKSTDFYLSVGLKPIDRLTIEPTYRYSRMVSLDYRFLQSGMKYYDGYITRTRIRYQASKALSLRLVMQYNDFNRIWDIDPLLTYRISSFSVFYVGSTYDYCELMQNPMDQKSPANWRLTSRQFFMKLQYLFQT